MMIVDKMIWCSLARFFSLCFLFEYKLTPKLKKPEPNMCSAHCAVKQCMIFFSQCSLPSFVWLVRASLNSVWWNILTRKKSEKSFNENFHLNVNENIYIFFNWNKNIFPKKIWIVRNSLTPVFRKTIAIWNGNSTIRKIFSVSAAIYRLHNILDIFFCENRFNMMGGGSSSSSNSSWLAVEEKRANFNRLFIDL